MKDLKIIKDIVNEYFDIDIAKKTNRTAHNHF